MKAKEPQRLYVVTDKRDGGACLVEANTPKQALYYAAKFYCDVKAAGTREAVKLLSEGVDHIKWTPESEQLDLVDQQAEQFPFKEVTVPGTYLKPEPEPGKLEVYGGPSEPAGVVQRAQTHGSATQPPPRTRVQPAMQRAADAFGNLPGGDNGKR